MLFDHVDGTGAPLLVVSGSVARSAVDLGHTLIYIYLIKQGKSPHNPKTV